MPKNEPTQANGRVSSESLRPASSAAWAVASVSTVEADVARGRLVAPVAAGDDDRTGRRSSAFDLVHDLGERGLAQPADRHGPRPGRCASPGPTGRRCRSPTRRSAARGRGPGPRRAGAATVRPSRSPAAAGSGGRGRLVVALGPSRRRRAAAAGPAMRGCGPGRATLGRGGAAEHERAVAPLRRRPGLVVGQVEDLGRLDRAFGGPVGRCGRARARRRDRGPWRPAGARRGRRRRAWAPGGAGAVAGGGGGLRPAGSEGSTSPAASGSASPRSVGGRGVASRAEPAAPVGAASVRHRARRVRCTAVGRRRGAQLWLTLVPSVPRRGRAGLRSFPSTTPYPATCSSGRDLTTPRARALARGAAVDGSAGAHALGAAVGGQGCRRRRPGRVIEGHVVLDLVA